MPKSAPRPCVVAGCGRLAVSGRCSDHPRAIDYDTQRGSAYDRGYTHRWAVYRAEYLRAHPICVRCDQITPASVVDHIIPHRGRHDLMWAEDNLQALCKRCHDRKTVTEDGGFGNVMIG